MAYQCFHRYLNIKILLYGMHKTLVKSSGGISCPIICGRYRRHDLARIRLSGRNRNVFFASQISTVHFVFSQDELPQTFALCRVTELACCRNVRQTSPNAEDRLPSPPCWMPPSLGLGLLLPQN